MSKATFDPKKYNQSSNEPFSSVLEKEVSRRSLLKSGAGMSALTMFSGVGLFGCAPRTSIGFESIPGSKTDAVTVAEGYSAQVLAPWGTPLNSMAQEWQADGSNTAADQENSVGMHHDGMSFFGFDEYGTDGLLCINHEYIDQNALHPNGASRNDEGLRFDAEEIRKEINAHGVTVVRIKKEGNVWNVVTDDSHNRRFTGATEMDIAGPLAGHDSLITPYSPTGTVARGTLNNCGNGRTPWGTYLTCEENWPGYFVNTGEQTEDQQRIGVDDEDTRYGWDDVAGDASETDSEFSRFDVTAKGESPLDDYRNEANGHGYIVEIDPYNSTSRAVKRTALGRFRHEGCELGHLIEGKPVVFYTGHDARFEYVYKFVSDALWDPADANSTDRLAVGDKYMNEGTLYVARFDEGGVGVWLPLTLDSATVDGGVLGDTFDSLADIILNTAGAADLVGATPMDRPEWAAVDQYNGTVYLTLTNNTRRTDSTNPANPRLDNKFGHIIRWNEGYYDFDGTFTWDIFLFGSPADGDAETNLSGLTDLNQLASPDGLAFDDRGFLWVQTDNGADEVEDYTNDQMLAVIPNQLVDADGNQEVISAENQMELRRFFVGPNRCEVTGFGFTDNHKNIFINIQHPGNWPYSANAAEETPAGTTIRPRAATVVITKDDGGEVGA